MSSSLYPLGMKSYNNSLPSGGWKTWKGSESHSNPVAVTAGNIRPLTNNDPTNNAIGPTPIYPSCAARNSFVKRPFLPRPMKHYRKGTTTPVPLIIQDPEDPAKFLQLNNNRAVRSSKSSSLIGQTIDAPGLFSVKQNPPNEIDGTTQLGLDCKTCDGIGLVAGYYPERYLTNNPEEVSTNYPNSVPGKQTFCCNAQQKALRMVRPASTNLKKNYFTTLQQYRQNRCQTYQQRIFNFKTGVQELEQAYDLKNNPLITENIIKNAKPGGSVASLNLYVANCYPNTDLSTNSQVYLISQIYAYLNNAGIFSNEDIQQFIQNQITTFKEFSLFIKDLRSGKSEEALVIFERFLSNPYLGMSLSGPSNPRGCKLVVYKPSNPQFATQGGVMSSARTLKLGLTTIEKNVANIQRLKGSGPAINYANTGSQPFVPFIYKSKTPKCNPAYYIKDGNPRTCGLFKSVDFNSTLYSNLGQTSAGPNVATDGISTSF